ncbi:hypothetical protein KKC91_12695 [bacterium]|nr:hypothetical protein [bacterium]
MFRARPPGDGLPDLAAVAGEVCIASCDHGPVKVSWGVANQGHADAAGLISVALYADHADGETLLAVQNIGELRYGTQVGGETFEIDPEDWGDGIRIVVDDDGTGTGDHDECDEANNIWEIAGTICP